jgi:CHAT domain-containing protein/tetratricopeptide (TPR) repeat protein
MSSDNKNDQRVHLTSIVALRQRGQSLLACIVVATITATSLARAEESRAPEAKEEIVRIAEKINIQNDEDLGKAIELANKLALLGETTQASVIWEKAVTWGEMNLGREHPELATGLINLANLYQDLERYSEAEALLWRAAEIDKKNHGPQSMETAGTLNDLAMALLKQDKIQASRRTQQEALDIYSSILEPDHYLVGLALNNLGLIYKEAQQLDVALEYLNKSLAISLKSNDDRARELAAATLGTLAVVYIYKAQYAHAEDALITALKMQGSAGTPKSEFEASTIYSIFGDLYRLQGRYSESEEALRKSVQIRARETGEHSRATIAAKSNLALTYKAFGKMAEARALYGEALSSSEKAFGNESSQLITLLSNIGQLHAAEKDYVKALEITERGLKISRKIFGDSHPGQISMVNNLGHMYFNLGKHDKGFYYLGQTIEKTRQQYGDRHPWHFQALRSFALRMIGGRQPTSAVVARLNKALNRELEWLLQEVPSIADANRSKQLQALGGLWMIPFQLIEFSPQYTDLAVRTRINRHGIIQEVQRKQYVLSRSRPINEERVASLDLLRSQAASVNLTDRQRKDLQNRLKQAERETYRLFPDSGLLVLEPELILQAIPVGGALVEFQRFRSLDLLTSNSARQGEERYLALVLRPGVTAVSVELGPADQIDSAIHKALNASAEDNSDAQYLWGQVSKMVVAPLAPVLKGNTQWFISPDGELNRVPFAALPTPINSNQLLGQAVQVRLLTTGRDLLHLQEDAKSSQPSIVFANPNFDRISRQRTVIASEMHNDQHRNRSADLVANRWPHLPASEREGEEISTLLATQLITDDNATTTRLLQLRSPRVLHIASHGFFVADVENKPNDPLLALWDQSDMLQPFRGEDPQLRSGLVLAGANQPDADPFDDGYLTAAEALILQLDGTELVVLSACSTGQGEIRTGEGVYGLQRSLAVAGARSTLLSLWKVDDGATAEFMSRLYTRLKAGEGRSDALVATQKEFREGLVRDPQSGLIWDSPYYWAAWQLVGDWRPIKGL